MTTAQIAQQRVGCFERLHNAFYEYYQDSLRKDGSKFMKYRLQLLTEFWEDVELMRRVDPIFQEFSSTLAEKRAVARAALYDALVAHTFGSYLNTSEQMLHKRMEELEANTTAAVHLLHTQMVALDKAVKADRPAKAATKSKEPQTDAVSKG